MKAIQAIKPGELRLVDVPEPQPRDDEALIEVRYAGICGSDLHGYRGVHPFMTYPRLLGHEIAGVVLSAPRKAAAAAGQIKPGDRVIVEPYLNCRTCHMCQAGRTNACVGMQVIGVHVDGGMCERLAIRANKLHRVPEHVSLKHAALVEPLGIGFHAVQRGKIRPGQKVYIIGAGPIGLSVLAAAKMAGASVAISDLIDKRLGVARQLGAELALDAVDQAGLSSQLKDWTGGIGPDVVIEAAGRGPQIIRGTQLPDTIVSAFEAVRPGGTVVLVGMKTQPVELVTRPIMAKELDVYASRNSVGLYGRILDALAAVQVRADALISHEIRLADVPEVIPAMCDDLAGYLKVLIRI